ncbi:MAG: glucodextranase DOMON-like domain-containing protein [Desulfurococcaceae archaeon]
MFALKKAYVLLALLATAILVAAPRPLQASPETITIAVDLAHGESDRYLGFIQGNITSVNVYGKVYRIKWVNITPGTTITSELLAGVDILLIGQPTVKLKPEEMEAIKKWLSTGNKALYIAGDSDYGGGPASIEAVNTLLEYIGVKLRLEHGAVYSEVNKTYVYKGVTYPTTAAAYYRTLAFVEPDRVPFLKTSILEEGITKPILMHGPTCIIWVDEAGKYHDPVNETYPGLIRMVWFRQAYMGDNQPPSPYVYDVLEYGIGGPKYPASFVGYASEYWPLLNTVITVAGESLYGDYEPAWSSRYYGVDLDGPRFVTNLVRWWISIIKSKVLEFDDPVEDDKGPGTLKYPTNKVFKPGVFDIVKFQVFADDEFIYLRTTFRDYGGNPWNGPNGFSLQLIHVYILTTDPALPKNKTAPGLKVEVYHGWHYLAVAAPGWGGKPWPDGEAGALYASNGTLIAGEGDLFDVYYVGGNSIDIKISKALLSDVENLGSWVFAVAVASYDGFGAYRVRSAVPGDPQEWQLGGADPQAVTAGVQPLVIDFLAPTPEDQYALLKLYDPAAKKLAIIAGMSKLGFMGPMIVKVTETVTQTQVITTTAISPVTVRETVRETRTVTSLVTTTVPVPEYTPAIGVGVVAVIIIAVLAYMLARKKPGAK